MKIFNSKISERVSGVLDRVMIFAAVNFITLVLIIWSSWATIVEGFKRMKSNEPIVSHLNEKADDSGVEEGGYPV